MSHGFNTGYSHIGWFDTEEMMAPDFDWSILEKLHTRELLDLRISQAARENPILHAEIKKVLATREHIPTKAEKKAERQKLAKAQRNK